MLRRISAYRQYQMAATQHRGWYYKEPGVNKEAHGLFQAADMKEQLAGLKQALDVKKTHIKEQQSLLNKTESRLGSLPASKSHKNPCPQLLNFNVISLFIPHFDTILIT